MDTDTRLKIAPLFRRNLRPNFDSPDLMMTLPPELRNQVYELALSDSTRRYWLCKEPPLLETCKQIRREAMPVFYKKFKVFFSAHIDSRRFHAFLQKIRQVISICGPAPFKKFELHFPGSVWQNLKCLLPLLELMRETGFEPASQDYQPLIKQPGPGRVKPYKVASQTSIFVMKSYDYGVLQQALERLVTLGRRARDSGWSKEKLAASSATAAKQENSRRGREVKGTRKPSKKGG